MASPLLCVNCQSKCQPLAIRRLETQLSDLMQHEITTITSAAFSQNLIGRQLHDSEASDREKAAQLLTVVSDRMKTDHTAFDKFLAILRDCPFLEHLADLVERQLREIHYPATSPVEESSVRKSPAARTKPSKERLGKRRGPRARPVKEHPRERRDESTEVSRKAEIDGHESGYEEDIDDGYDEDKDTSWSVRAGISLMIIADQEVTALKEEKAELQRLVKEGEEATNDLEEQLKDQEVQLEECNIVLAEKVKELQSLELKHEATLKEAKERLKQEQQERQAKIEQVKQEVVRLGEELCVKTKEANSLIHQNRALQQENKHLRESNEALQRDYEVKVQELEELRKKTQAEIKELVKQLDDKNEMAIQLERELKQLRSKKKAEISQLEEEYQKEIQKLQSDMESEKKHAALKEENIAMKLKLQIGELKLKIKSLETNLAQEQTKVAQKETELTLMQRKEMERDHEEKLRLVHEESQVKIQEVSEKYEKEIEDRENELRRLSSQLSVASSTKSTTAGPDRLESIDEKKVEFDFTSSNSDEDIDQIQ